MLMAQGLELFPRQSGWVGPSQLSHQRPSGTGTDHCRVLAVAPHSHTHSLCTPRHAMPATVQSIVLEIGTAGPVSLISNIYLVVTADFQYYLGRRGQNPVSQFPRPDFQGNRSYCRVGVRAMEVASANPRKRLKSNITDLTKYFALRSTLFGPVHS